MSDQVIARARTNARVNIRIGAPALAAPVREILDPGTEIFITAAVTGDDVHGNDQWYACRGDVFVWSGACENYHEEPAPPGDGENEGERPSRVELGEVMQPEFETLPGVFHKVRGYRPGGLEGLIVHFDAARTLPDSDRSTREVMRYGAEQGYHYGAISRSGRIFLPQGFNWEAWGYHAGTSQCPVTDRKGVSQYYVGFELNNPGLLYPAQQTGVFCPWFNAERDEKGRVILDADGRCTRRDENDEWYRDYEVRLCEGGNITKGWYLPYSAEQFAALTRICIWLSRRFPDSFSLERVFGHDEVSPGRKSDPGGAMGTPTEMMTMAEFRSSLMQLAR
ncbi:N-acetylmuramoyl-L-alanine amidase [Maricaulis sp.]|uniref:peptidoglycan recognition protein family protein n=1 Tax=Maricaulis sp. TaxID=1486257 RepID=UPI003A912FDC